MLRLRTEGIVAAAGVSGLVLIDPNPTLLTRGQPIVDVNARIGSVGATSQQDMTGAQARFMPGSFQNVTSARARFQAFAAALENSHPVTTDGPSPFHAIEAWMRWKGSVTNTNNLHARFRDQMCIWNLTNGIDPITANSGSHTGQWYKAVTAFFVGQEWRNDPNIGSTDGAASQSAVQNRYNYVVNTWIPTVAERLWKNGYPEYYSPTYSKSLFSCFWLLAKYATNTSIKDMGQFLLDQLMIETGQVFAFGQWNTANLRQIVHMQGCPRFGGASEIMAWYFFGGQLMPGIVWESGPLGGGFEYSQAESYYTVPFVAAISEGFQTPGPAWRINQAISQVGSAIAKSRHRAAIPLENIRATRPHSVYTYVRQNYSVSSVIYDANYDHIGQSFHFHQLVKARVTWRANSASSTCQFGISNDSHEEPFNRPEGGVPITTRCETCLQVNGTIVQAFLLEPEDPQFIEGWISDDFVETLTSGNWWFGRTNNVMIAVWFSRGFAVQSPKDCINVFNPEPDVLLPWFRSPASGGNARHAVVIETAAPSDYASLSAFRSVITSTARGGQSDGVQSFVNDSNPRIRYTALNGDVLDLTYTGNKTVNGIGHLPFKRIDSPWVQLDYGANDMFVTDPATGQVTRYRWSDKSITLL